VPINELAIVTALSRQLLAQTGKNAFPLAMGAVQGKRTVFSTHLCIGGQQCQSQPRHFQAEPRDSHAVCTLRVHPPTSPSPALSAVAEPISWGHCRRWHHKRKISCRIYPATSGKGLTYPQKCVSMATDGL